MVLLVLAMLPLLLAALYVVSYVDVASFGDATDRPSFGEYMMGGALWQAPVTAVLLGCVAGAAGIGLLRGRRWGQILAIGIGLLSLVAAVALGVNAIVGWSQPGSFAILSVPPALVALAVGAFVLHGAIATQAYFRGGGT